MSNLSPSDYADLETAVAKLETQSFAMRIAAKLGMPVEALLRRLPAPAQSAVQAAVDKALEQCLRIRLGADTVTIGEGEKVLLFMAAANRDHRRWPEPDKFDIKRRVAGHVALGSGIHGCVGQSVARLEGELPEKPPVELPMSIAMAPRGSSPKCASACASLTPPRETHG